MEGLTFSQYNTLRMCEFYANSKYLSRVNPSGISGYGTITGNIDELGRDAPFYNIVNFRVTIAKVATDLDIKDINITSDDPQNYVKAMLLRRECFEWMKESNFGLFLNRFGYTRPKYGGVLVKKHEDTKESELSIQVVEWKNAVTDQVNIANNPIIERHYMTPSELLKKKDVWENVREVLEHQKDLKAAKKYGVKDISNRICVYEVTGEFPIEYLKNAQDDNDIDDEDKYEYTLQRYFIADVYGKSFVLSSDEIKESPYKFLPWEEMEGRALGRGVTEDCEEAQVWTNDAVKNEKSVMDLAGKVVMTTNSKKVGNNILEVDNGKIFQLEEGKELTMLNLTPAAIGQFQNQISKWQQQADGATSSYDAVTGEQPPSGTPYSQTALLSQIASKPFDYRREEAGIFLQEIFEDWILPYLIKKLKKNHTLAADFDAEELAMIDKDFAINRANENVKRALKEGKFITPEQYGMMVEAEKLLGTKRYLEMPDGYFDGVEAKVSINPTGELKNKQAILQSLSTLMGDVIKSYNPNTGSFGVLENPQLSKIFYTILEFSGAGISPASMTMNPGNPAPIQGGNPQAPVKPIMPEAPVPQPQQVNVPTI